MGTIMASPNRDITLDDFKREMGIKAEDKIAANTIEAFSNPKKAYEAYVKERENIDNDAMGSYRAAFEGAAALGLPQETCLDYARRRAMTERTFALELFNGAHPYASNVESLIKLAKGKTEEK